MSNFTLTIRTVTDLMWKSQNLIGNLTCSHGKSNNFTITDGILEYITVFPTQSE